MKLRREFLVHTSGEESLLVPAGGAEFSGIVKGNSTFGEILTLLKNDITESQLTEKLCAKYDAPQDTIAKDVKNIIDTLRKVKALDE